MKQALNLREYEKEGTLPFLDILVIKKKGGILATKIYRKETHTNRNLNYESCHSKQQKQGIIISLLNRAAKLIMDSKDFKEEKEMLRCALEDNNYPNWLIKKTSNQFKFNKIEKQEKSKNYKGIVTLPYFQDITKILDRIITKQKKTLAPFCCVLGKDTLRHFPLLGGLDKQF